jgi:hypothetical protein
MVSYIPQNSRRSVDIGIDVVNNFDILGLGEKTGQKQHSGGCDLQEKFEWLHGSVPGQGYKNQRWD